MPAAGYYARVCELKMLLQDGGVCAKSSAGPNPATGLYMTNSTGYGRCRFCAAPLNTSFVDLGVTPLCQTHVSPEQLNAMEPFYPLHALVCNQCLLVQLDEYVAPDDIFSEYAYFSSYSDSWLRHAEEYCRMAAERFQLTDESLVVELASNDGYLLRNFVTAAIPCLGIEPAANVAEVARKHGIRTLTKFFGAATAKEVKTEYGAADLVVGNNVLAHVPDLNDFVAGMKILLGESGVITMEFPHLLRLMDEVQFDTIYHEHFSYFSFIAVTSVFRHHGLQVFDVDELPTHGGSLRIYAAHKGRFEESEAVNQLLAVERQAGLHQLHGYFGFQERVNTIKRNLLAFLIEAKREGKSVVGYGAPGKGNTLLNYCGIGPDFLDYTVDRNPYKQGKYTPGSRIPILSPERIAETRPDFIMILPWNLRDEITASHAHVAEWGARFIVPIPRLELIDPA